MSVVDINPDRVYFTFSRIRPQYSCGRTIESTLNAIRNKELLPSQLPQITLLTDGKNYFSLNNRRLYTFKTLKAEGLLQTIRARVKTVPQTKRMAEKYTPAKCSLVATLMRQKVNASGEEDDEDSGEDEDRLSDIEAEEKAAAAAAAVADVKKTAAPKVHGVLKEEGAMKVEKKRSVGFGDASENKVVEVIVEESSPTEKKSSGQLFTEKMLRQQKKKEDKKEKYSLGDGKRGKKKKNAKWQQQVEMTQHITRIQNGTYQQQQSSRYQQQEESDEDEDEEEESEDEAPAYSLRNAGGFGALLATGKRKR